MLQYTAYLISLAFLLRFAKATSSSLRCEKTNDVLKCSCLFDDFSNCATDLFTSQDFSGISKFHINCDNGNLSLAYFSQLAEGVMLAHWTIVQCELTDWHTTEALHTALSGLKSLTITQSFSTKVFPNFGDIFENLQHFSFYNNYLNHDNVPHVQAFDFAFENAVACISQSDATAMRSASNNTEFLMHYRSCFCTFVNSFVQLYCFGAHTLDLKNALSAAAHLPLYTNPIENCVMFSAISLHNLQFLINDSPDSDFGAILNDIVPGADIKDLPSSGRFMFTLDTCEQIGNSRNATDAWRELQGLLCRSFLKDNATKVSVVNCPQANALQLADNIVRLYEDNCGMLESFSLQYLDLSNNNITMEQYVAHFAFQLVKENLTVFNFSGKYAIRLSLLHYNVCDVASHTMKHSNVHLGNNLGILIPMFFYLISPYNLRHVDLSYSNLTEIKENPFDYLDNVEWMSLAGHSLAYVQYYWFRDRLKLKYLDLSNDRHLLGVWGGPGKTYPQIWPETLEHLDLSGSNLTDADEQEIYGASFGVRFTDKFFMGLSNLLVLNLSNTFPVLSAYTFKPLRSLEVLDITDSIVRIIIRSRDIPKDLLKYLTQLRSLYMGEVLRRTNEIYTSPCEFFKYTAMLSKLNLKRSNFNIPGIWDVPPDCVDLLGLYGWVQGKKLGYGNFTFLEDDKLLCTYKKTQYSFADMHALMADHSIHFNLSLTVNKATTLHVTTAAPIDKRSLLDPASPQPARWTQMRMPLFVCLAIISVVILLCIPTRVMFPAFLPGEYNPETRRKSQSDLSKSEAKNIKNKRKELKHIFLEETGINGFLFAHRSQMMVERLAWYAVMLAFTGILISQIIDLWEQFYYSNPSTQSTMVSAAKFPQNSFTLCFPVKKRNHYELTKDDVYQLAEKPKCDEDASLTLPIRNGLLRDMVMYRIGAQMAWEGGTLKQNLTVTEALKAMDDIVFGRNLSYRNLLIEVNGLLCDVTQFTASMRNLDDSDEDRHITVNPTGCANLVEKQGFGLTWYDLIETDTACMRFPGLFNFTGFQQEGMLQFQPWQFFYNHTAAKIDLGGYEYPLAAGPNSYPARANLHHDTSMVLQLKSVYRNLPTYRSKTNRCYKNCIGTKRVAEIQATCKCRPLMFADLSDPTLPDCTLDIYKKCGLSRNGDLHHCADAVPCEMWDFAVLPTDNGLTPDNSTIIRFAGMNTLYVVYEELEARKAINFMGDVGGLFGLWLGGSMVAIVHIFFFCLKSIYWLVPWFGGRKCGDKNGRAASDIHPI